MKGFFGASAFALCLGLAFGPAPAMAQGIERGAEDFIDADEAIAQSERRFGVIDRDASGALSLDELGRGLTEADDPDTIFREMDADSDLSITSQEWMNWRERRVGELTEGAGGMSRRDFQTFDRGGAVGTADLGGEPMRQDLETSGRLGTPGDRGLSSDLGTLGGVGTSGDLGTGGDLGTSGRLGSSGDLGTADRPATSGDLGAGSAGAGGALGGGSGGAGGSVGGGSAAGGGSAGGGSAGGGGGGGL